MKKCKTENSKSRKSQKSYTEFSILFYSQNRKLGFKNLEKKFRDFRDFRGFRVSDLAVSYYSNIKEVVSFEKIILKSLLFQKKIKESCIT